MTGMIAFTLLREGILAHFLQPPHLRLTHNYHSVTVSMVTTQQVLKSLEEKGPPDTSVWFCWINEKQGMWTPTS